MARYVSFRDFDWLLLVFVFIICCLGVLEIRSATAHTKFAGAHIKQLYWIAGSMANARGWSVFQPRRAPSHPG